MGCVLGALLVGSAAHAEVQWQHFVEPYSQVFPSLEIATATMTTDPEDDDPAVVGDQDGLIGVTLSGAPAGSRFDLVVRIPGYARDSRLSGTLPTVSEDISLTPLISWDYTALAALRQPKPATIEFELSLDGQPLGTRSERVRMRSVNDALYFIDEEDDADDLDFNWLFAAYVNEDHPAVDQILKEALDSGIVDGFTGYQDEDPDQVLKQVYAIWHVLQMRGIRYSSITRTANEHENVLSQHVRFIDESLAMTQANCVDGSVLFASILRKIDINPELVLTPGHMFLGFALDEAGEKHAYLETTMLGDVKPAAAGKFLGGLKDQVGLGVDKEATFTSFSAAIAEGQSEVDEAGDAFSDENDSDHQMIDIQAAREMGVMPITR